MSGLIYAKEKHIARLTLNRPESGNFIDSNLSVEIEDCCRVANEDDDVYAVILTGAGEAFCRGGELGMGQHPAGAIAAIEKPVIAAIGGDAFGEGMELILACDIRIAGERARFCLPDISRGLIPSDGGTQRLPRIVGRARALELLLTARTISAREAYEIGLVSRLSEGDPIAEAAALADTIAAKAPISLRYTKEAVSKGLDLTLEQGLRLEADLYFLIHTTADRTEGIKAFLSRRPPKFEGR